MLIFMYTTNEEPRVALVVGAPKEQIERTLRRTLTQQEYEAEVAKALPAGAINPRPVAIENMPGTREFRNAWVDITPEAKIDICCSRARDLKLEQLRLIRNMELEKLDKEFMIGVEKGLDLTEIKNKKEALRNVTEPLKALNVAGKVNDLALLQQIRDLGQLTS